MRHRTLGRILLAAVTAAIVLSCAEAPTGVSPRGSIALSDTDSPPSDGDTALLPCPSSGSSSAQAVLGSAGGRLTAGPVTLIVPLNALTAPTTLRVYAPSSPYLTADITANGRNGFLFALPVTVIVDYSRCPASALGIAPLHAVYLPDGTYQVQQDMGGVDLRLTRQLVFTTGHLSMYAIAQ